MTKEKIIELLDMRDGDFKEIERLLVGSGAEDHERLMRHLNHEQPKEWIEENVNPLTGKKYYSNNWQLIEAMMYRVFPEWTTIIMDNYTTSAKPLYSVTTRVKICLGVGMNDLHGIASECVEDLRILNLATPLSVVSAKKNAIKQLGTLFGRDLNRNTEDLLTIKESQVNTPSVRDETTIQYEVVRDILSKAPTKAMAELILSTSSFKLSPELKNIVNLKS